jgi:hypothetical protein
LELSLVEELKVADKFNTCKKKTEEDFYHDVMKWHPLLSLVTPIYKPHASFSVMFLYYSAWPKEDCAGLERLILNDTCRVFHNNKYWA